MIAVKEYRGRGLSKQVMEVIELFAQGYYNKNTIIAKIKKDAIINHLTNPPTIFPEFQLTLILRNTFITPIFSKRLSTRDALISAEIPLPMRPPIKNPRAILINAIRIIGR